LLPPGEVRRLPGPAVDRMVVSTHGLPILFFRNRLESSAQETVILGIEPADPRFGEGLPSKVNVAVEWPVGVLAAGRRRGHRIDCGSLWDQRTG
jgi:hypothetical protein